MILEDDRIDLVSFTGSTEVGRHAAKTVGGRFGRTVLELGGNNAVLVMDDADEQAALTSVLFAAVGTCGQVCFSSVYILNLFVGMLFR
jgi:acyl-CoA reductase-like NAD-dependent aldehyde dehydrogenase